MQQSDVSSSYYHFYQPQNPDSSSNPIDPLFNPLPATHASAPPLSSSYSSSDYSNYSSNYHPYPQNTNPIPNPQASGIFHNYRAGNFDNPIPNPSYDPNLVSSSYYSYDQNQRDVNYGGFREDAIGEGVYAYNGGQVEPYGARGSRLESTSALTFDDYGRPLNFTGGNGQNGSSTLNMIVKAAPKTEMEQDVKSGVQKFRVKLLSEGGGQSDMDVLCQIGLDGIRILDPATSRILKIYPLETVTRWEVLDSHIFAFWTQSSIDIEARRIRLKSNSYTTTIILDMVAAASFQLKEMGGDTKTVDLYQVSEQTAEKKKGFVDWMNLMKPGNEEKDHWVPDEAATKCVGCGTYFGAFVRRHHCRNCGDIFCDKCTQGRIALTAEEHAQPVRVCDRCMAEATQRLSNAKGMIAKVGGFHSHEDLAKKLQEEMDKNRKTSTGIKSQISDVGMREVECPTCTVHLQVQVPASGSKTIECSVCQHPFLVSAH